MKSVKIAAAVAVLSVLALPVYAADVPSMEQYSAEKCTMELANCDTNNPTDPVAAKACKDALVRNNGCKAPAM